MQLIISTEIQLQRWTFTVVFTLSGEQACNQAEAIGGRSKNFEVALQ